MGNILIVAAHPDDEILGCGVAIQAHLEAKDSVSVLVLTNGSDGRYNEAKKNELLENCYEANKFLGVPNVILRNFAHQKLDTEALWDIVRDIEQHIQAFNIDTIYTHHLGDINQDHRIVYNATITACRPIPEQKVKRLLAYWVPSSSDYGYLTTDLFVPNWFIKATKDRLDNKIKAMGFYLSESRQYPNPRSSEGLKIAAQSFGVKFGMEAVEPFQIIYDRTASL